MKRKHVITTFSLSVALGLGVFAGLSLANKNVKEVKAASMETIYLTPGPWATAGAKFSVYTWGGTSGATTSAFMTQVATDDTTYQTEVPSDNSNVVFIRNTDTATAPGFDEKWNQTGDLTKTANRYTVTGWGENDGAWSSYTPPAAASVYTATIGDGEPVELTKTGSEYHLAADTALAKDTALKFFKDGVEQDVAVKADSGLYSNNAYVVGGEILVRKAATTNFYWDISTNEVWVGGYGNPVDGAVYLLGSFNGWAGNATVATTEDDENYTFTNVFLSAGAEFKAVQYNDPDTDYIEPTAGVSSTYPVEYPVTISNTNVKVTNSTTYDIKVNITTGKYTIVPVASLPEYKVLYNDLVTTTFTQSIDSLPDGVVNQFKATLPYAAIGKKLVFKVDDTTITSNLTVSAGANNVMGDLTNGFRVHNSYDGMTIYLKQFSNGAFEVWGDHYSVTTLSIDSKTMVFNDEFVQTATYAEEYYVAEANYTAGQIIGATTDDLGYEFDIAKEDVESNNLDVVDGKIKVHNACTGQKLYLKRNVTDGKFYLYLGGLEHTYQITIAGNNIDLSDYNPETQEYSATFSVTAGQTVTAITKDGVDQPFTVKQIGNNNLTSEKQIIVSGVYTGYYNVNTGTLFIGGMTFGGYHIIKNSGTADASFVQMTHGEDFEGFQQYYSASIDFAVNDTIRFIDTNAVDSLAVPFSITTINTGGLGSSFTVDGDVIKCLESCSAQVYMKLKSGADEVYFGSEPEQVGLAKEFANKFKSDMNNSCSQAENKQSSVESAWGGCATAYAALDASVKAVLQEGASSSVAEIREFHERYMAIKLQHSDWELDNFMGWDIPASANFTLSNVVKNNSTMIIVVVASISAISLVGLFFIIKRRKHN